MFAADGTCTQTKRHMQLYVRYAACKLLCVKCPMSLIGSRHTVGLEHAGSKDGWLLLHGVLLLAPGHGCFVELSVTAGQLYGLSECQQSGFWMMILTHHRSLLIMQMKVRICQPVAVSYL